MFFPLENNLYFAEYSTLSKASNPYFFAQNKKKQKGQDF
tara:strand:+ start:502 stop:618 length:117 start_codon:yes stop_codon:yes gene_type:complete